MTENCNTQNCIINYFLFYSKYLFQRLFYLSSLAFICARGSAHKQAALFAVRLGMLELNWTEANNISTRADFASYLW